MKFEVTIAQTKAVTVEVDGDTSDKAVENAKNLVKNHHFDSRIGSRVVAGVREIKESG